MHLWGARARVAPAAAPDALPAASAPSFHSFVTMGSLAVRMCSLLSRRAAVACQNRAALPIGAIAGPQALLDRLYSNYAASSSDPHPHKHAFEEQEHTCWSCSDHFKRGGLICRSCDKIQPVDSALTYYDLLG
jgi:hypothetical protein